MNILFDPHVFYLRFFSPWLRLNDLDSNGKNSHPAKFILPMVFTAVAAMEIESTHF